MFVWIFLLSFVLIGGTTATTRKDFTGLYHFEQCLCSTVPSCPASSSYSLFHQSNDQLIVNHFDLTAAHGQIKRISQQNRVELAIDWLPGTNFPSNCSGLWIEQQRIFQLRCGDQFRFCTGQFTCQRNSGPCDQSASSTAATNRIHRAHIIWFLLSICVSVCQHFHLE